MALKLGDYELNKKLTENAIDVEREIHRLKINLLVKELEKQICPMVEDIIDTYYYIKLQLQDESFAKDLLQKLINGSKYFSLGRKNTFRIQSPYRMLSISKDSVHFIKRYVGEVKYDICHHFCITEDDLCNSILDLQDVIERYNFTNDELKKIGDELEYILSEFPTYAKSFFDSVSNYKIC